MAATSNTDLSAGYTTIVFTDSVFPTNPGTHMSINGSGNLSIDAQGVYRIDVYAVSITIPANQGTQLDYDVRTISGSAGRWSNGATSSPQLGATALLSIQQTPSGSKADGSGSPHISVTAAWPASSTFPAVVRVQIQYSVDQTATANTTGTWQLGVTRLGDAFE